MLASFLIAYYVVSLVYVCCLFVFKKSGAVLQAMILLACPFISVLLLLYMHTKSTDNGQLPDWLLKREDYKDFSLQSPDRAEEINVIPFQDALTLNDNRTKRKTLIGLLKNEFMQQAAALELALQSEDTETSHYAAAALQEAKSKLMKELRRLEAQLAEDPSDASALLAYLDVLKQSIQMEFLDGQTRKKYMYSYFHALTSFIELDAAAGPDKYKEKISMALELSEFAAARQTADAFLDLFPNEEDAYFASMNVHFQMKNREDFLKTVNQLRSSSTKLSPERLNQLRFWLQGDEYEQSV